MSKDDRGGLEQIRRVLNLEKGVGNVFQFQRFVFRKILGFFLGYLGLAAALGFCFAIGETLSGGDSELGIGFSLGLSIFFGFITWKCFKMSRRFFKHPEADPATKARAAEQIILDLAISTDGTLTIAEIAARSELSVTEAKDGIEALTREGVATVEFDERQDVYYRFPGLTKEM